MVIDKGISDPADAEVTSSPGGGGDTPAARQRRSGSPIEFRLDAASGVPTYLSDLGKRYRQTWVLHECTVATPAGHVAAGPRTSSRTPLEVTGVPGSRAAPAVRRRHPRG